MLTIAETAEGTLIRVETLAPMPRSERPTCRCVVCLSSLVPKLGRIVRHHFAHHANSTCPASGGEGELHLEAKLHLHLVLEEAIREEGLLQLRDQCLRCNAPVLRPLLQLQAGDKAHFERRLEQFRPDVLVSRARNPIGAFEIVVTNPCTELKWQTLAGLTTALVEVDALEMLAVPSASSWLGGAPPKTRRVRGLPPPSNCDACAWRADDERRRPIEEAVIDRWIETRHDDGLRRRRRFVVRRVWLDDACIGAEVIGAQSKLGWVDGGVAGDLPKLRARARPLYRSYRASLQDPTTVAITEWDAKDPSAAPDDVWWSRTRREWIRCYAWKDLPRILGVSGYATLSKWFKQGKLNALDVQYRLGEKPIRMYVAEDADRFAAWLASRRRNDAERRP